MEDLLGTKSVDTLKEDLGYESKRYGLMDRGPCYNLISFSLQSLLLMSVYFRAESSSFTLFGTDTSTLWAVENVYSALWAQISEDEDYHPDPLCQPWIRPHSFSGHNIPQGIRIFQNWPMKYSPYSIYRSLVIFVMIQHYDQEQLGEKRTYFLL